MVFFCGLKFARPARISTYSGTDFTDKTFSIRAIREIRGQNLRENGSSSYSGTVSSRAPPGRIISSPLLPGMLSPPNLRQSSGLNGGVA
jgi:hypothetical protein